MLSIPQIRQAVAKVGRKYGIRNAYLFGSYARGEATEDSDVDIVVDKGDIHSFREFFHLHSDLENELGTKVDLLTDKSITPQFYDRISRDRVLLYGV